MLVYQRVTTTNGGLNGDFACFNNGSTMVNNEWDDNGIYPLVI